MTAIHQEQQRWRKNFDNYASLNIDGVKYLGRAAFIDAIAPRSGKGHARISRDQYGVFFDVADKSNKGIVSVEDFITFENLLKQPDAPFQVAFQYFDKRNKGSVSFNDFKNVFSQYLGNQAIPFDFNCDWLKLYLGKTSDTNEHVLAYHEFTQMMKGLQGERIRQAFHYFDKDNDGWIRPEDFQKIILEVASHKLSGPVLDRLPSLCHITADQRISYADVRAFYNVLHDMDAVEHVVDVATAQSPDGRISPSDFLATAQRNTRYGSFSPMEVAFAWHLASPGAVGRAGTPEPDVRLSKADFDALFDPNWTPIEALAPSQPPKSALHETLMGIYNFALGGLAGATGATVVYPIDLVKTRMQNQRSAVVGEMMYTNSIDCVKKVMRNEGFKGFYRGLLPQLVGVAPEKAIKLTVNDAVRHLAQNTETGQISLPWEIIAGGAAGGSQVVFTNPLEIVKIRLQIQGEAAKLGEAQPRGAFHIIRQLGLLGLYKGATACLLRDVPFSMVYFTSYAHLKKDFFKEGLHGKKLGFGETLLSAAVAGMPAAYLTTPADVIKTRLQAEARQGQTNYRNVGHAFTSILKEEGAKALFKGGPARVLRSSPQFGVTLVAYEWLHKLLPYPFRNTESPSVGALLPQREEDITRVRARNALKLLLDTHCDFGRVRVH
ncbi:mitochondrial carrier [Wallemia mellicola CBS 633.66]|uniref:Mitochondrial aspartate-glutamate transporter AGC1 n=1 Tax=Wallemia mellicola (strain ATCC MYA-4683 / CBS 633.66) TaxID=671144 RepID=I4YH52_WALMC|nr:mitochondrial carrier [Wallemia mellicola CBS 633.66]EIM23294.1 mitochondrial carrier [Wallemia mellicola CBS 633.66]|eukprot:XP_006956682.1 mitochondrial carrier [Wallemia mellicola CBS 633.66]